MDSWVYDSRWKWIHCGWVQGKYLFAAYQIRVMWPSFPIRIINAGGLKVKIGQKVKTQSRPGQVGEVVDEMYTVLKVRWPDGEIIFHMPETLIQVDYYQCNPPLSQ